MVIVAIVSRRTMTRKTPEIVDVDTEELEDLLRRAEQALDADDTELIRRVFESYNYVIGVLEHKHTSLNRLRKLLFGARTEKTAAVGLLGCAALVGAHGVQHRDPSVHRT